ncbi:MAG: pyridine nucleotide-disulfide oxidoreductase, partial [Candidatus Eremiobacteraeota bacterium]|nr:pyridine nucleotide-disulfide oxidoreductase [Candidatus Eremiobacteraeota bacterium]
RYDYRSIGGRVLLIGSGLTALDALVALDASGHRGLVHVVSRRGRFPEKHAEGLTPYDLVPAIDTASARAALHSFRRHVRDAAERGFDWRAVVDAIRPETEALWRRLPERERKRFERHLRGAWERHRHRAPAGVAAARDRYAEAGRLIAHTGSVVAAQGRTVTLAVENGGRTTLRPDWIVNCTGPARSQRALRDSMMVDLLSAGRLAFEPLGHGFRAADDLRAIDAWGDPVANLWLAGPLVRGTRFEATAVPELRVMAENVARGIVAALASERREEALFG